MAKFRLPFKLFFVAVKCPQGGHPKGTTFDKIEFTEMLTSFSQTWALRRCCQETLSPIEISSSFPEKNLFELWNILLGQLRRALEEYLRIQRLVSPFFFPSLLSISLRTTWIAWWILRVQFAGCEFALLAFSRHCLLVHTIPIVIFEFGSL